MSKCFLVNAGGSFPAGAYAYRNNDTQSNMTVHIINTRFFITISVTAYLVAEQNQELFSCD